MNMQRIGALVSRNLLLTFRGVDPLIDLLYWPFFDLVVWGFTSRWVSSAGQEVSVMWLTGMVLWQACYRANLDVSHNLLNELWSRNVVNMFATPLELHEWIGASLIVGTVNTMITVLYGGLLAYLMYGVNIFSIEWFIVPLYLLLLVFGWSVGFVASGCLLNWGQKIQKIVWVLGWFFVPFSAIFFPLSFLPSWAAGFAKMLPLSYTFGSLRGYIAHGTIAWQSLGMSLVLTSIYSILSYLFFRAMFRQSKSKGLARLETE
jgi:ABC-2 type transport system permease protein